MNESVRDVPVIGGPKDGAMMRAPDAAVNRPVVTVPLGTNWIGLSAGIPARLLDHLAVYEFSREADQWRWTGEVVTLRDLRILERSGVDGVAGISSHAPLQEWHRPKRPTDDPTT